MSLHKEKTKQSKIVSCYFQVLKLGRVTAREISRRSGISEANISKFRKGADIYNSNYQKLLDALPEKLRRQYYLLLLEGESPQASDRALELDIADRLESSAYKLRQNRIIDN
ncbi:MAG: hypothetical protein QNJ72_23910 [Pleurocapsa sp. MO_226.B13]|nr:hypothetical protein [Pleurocapsa sp. MO_226.B13]